MITRMSFFTVDVSGDEMFTEPFFEHEPKTAFMKSIEDKLRQPPELWQVAAKVVISEKYAELIEFLLLLLLF